MTDSHGTQSDSDLKNYTEEMVQNDEEEFVIVMLPIT